MPPCTHAGDRHVIRVLTCTKIRTLLMCQGRACTHAGADAARHASMRAGRNCVGSSIERMHACWHRFIRIDTCKTEPRWCVCMRAVDNVLIACMHAQRTRRCARCWVAPPALAGVSAQHEATSAYVWYQPVRRVVLCAAA